MLRAALLKGVPVVAVNDPFIDLDYMVSASISSETIYGITVFKNDISGCLLCNLTEKLIFVFLLTPSLLFAF